MAEKFATGTGGDSGTVWSAGHDCFEKNDVAESGERTAVNVKFFRRNSSDDQVPPVLGILFPRTPISESGLVTGDCHERMHISHSYVPKNTRRIMGGVYLSKITFVQCLKVVGGVCSWIPESEPSAASPQRLRRIQCRCRGVVRNVM